MTAEERAIIRKSNRDRLAAELAGWRERARRESEAPAALLGQGFLCYSDGMALRLELGKGNAMLTPVFVTPEGGRAVCEGAPAMYSLHTKSHAERLCSYHQGGYQPLHVRALAETRIAELEETIGWIDVFDSENRDLG